jgi:hypothetical protein
MKVFVGIEIGADVLVTAVSPGKGVVARSEYELPSSDELRPGCFREAVVRALEKLDDRVPSCEAVGIAARPRDAALAASLLNGDEMDPTLPSCVSGAPVAFHGYEVEALHPVFGGGRDRAFLVMGRLSRLYGDAEVAERSLGIVDERGARRCVGFIETIDIMDPLRALHDSLGLFENIEEIQTYAGIVEDSGGAVFAPRYGQEDGYQGISVVGLRPEVRRPQVALAALEAVGAAVRYHAASLAGEGSVKELAVAGRAARDEFLLTVIAGMTGVTVVRAEARDTVAWGAAMRAAAARGESLPRPDRKRFSPKLPAARRDALYGRWFSLSQF